MLFRSYGQSTNLKLPAGAGVGTFSLSVSGAWTAASNSEWLAVSPGSGVGNATLTYSYSANTSSAGRVAQIVVSNKSFNFDQINASGIAPTWGSAGRGTISTLAGVGWSGYSGDCGTGGQYTPIDLAIDSHGNVIFADWKLSVVYKLDSLTKTVAPLTSASPQNVYQIGLAASQVYLNCPHGLAIDRNDNLYVGEMYGQQIGRAHV